MANLVKIKKILVSKTNKEYQFDVDLLCKLSNFIKNN